MQYKWRHSSYDLVYKIHVHRQVSTLLHPSAEIRLLRGCSGLFKAALCRPVQLGGKAAQMA